MLYLLHYTSHTPYTENQLGKMTGQRARILPTLNPPPTNYAKGSLHRPKKTLPLPSQSHLFSNPISSHLLAAKPTPV